MSAGVPSTAVLVVDDNRAMRMLVSRSLRSVEYVSQVFEADSAESAIDVLGEQAVGLVLCDWNMGGMSGVELLEALRSASWEVPFGFVTLESGEDMRRRALRAGAAFVVVKPFTTAGLAGQVDAFLSGRGPAIDLDDDARPERDRAERLKRLVGTLVDADVEVAEAAEGPSSKVPRRVACYETGGGKDVALLVVETALAGDLAAALVKMPTAPFGDWRTVGALPLALEEGFREVANVLARFVRPDGGRAVLSGLGDCPAGLRLPEPRWGADSAWEHLRLGVVNHGTGLLSIATRPSLG